MLYLLNYEARIVGTHALIYLFCISYQRHPMLFGVKQELLREGGNRCHIRYRLLLGIAKRSFV